MFNVLADNNAKAKEAIDAEAFTDPNEKKAYEFFKMHSGHIEISIEGKLQGIYFPIKPICKHLSKGSRTELMNNVDRSTPQEKVMGLRHAMPDLIKEMKHNESLSRKAIKITPKTLDNVYVMSIVVSILINLTMLFFYERERIDTKNLNVHPIPAAIVKYGGYVLLGLCGLCLLFYTIAQSALKVSYKWSEYNLNYRKTNRNSKIEDQLKRLKVHEMSINQTRYILHMRGPDAGEFNLEEERNFGNLFTAVEYYIICFIFALKDPWFHYYIAYFMLAY